MKSEKQAKDKKRKAKKMEVPELDQATLDRIEQRIESTDSIAEKEYLTEYLKMFRRLRKLISKSYRDCLAAGGGRGYYALCTLISQQREVIADIRVMSDFSAQLDLVHTGVLTPLERRNAQAILDSYYHARRLVTETTDKKQSRFALSKLEEIFKELAATVRQSHADALAGLTDTVMGDGGGKSGPKKRKA